LAKIEHLADIVDGDINSTEVRSGHGEHIHADEGDRTVEKFFGMIFRCKFQWTNFSSTFSQNKNSARVRIE
jgi:hypothetical protein